MLTCPACGFENMPGSLVCARCRGRLVWDGSGDKADFQPPRAGRGKIWRRSLYYLRAKIRARSAPARSRRLNPEELGRAFAAPWRGWVRLPFANKLAAVLSLIPGLGHVTLGKYGSAAARFLGWLGWLAILGLMYGYDGVTFACLAGPMWFGASLFHIFTAVSAALPDYRHEDREVRSAAVMIAIVVAVIYLIAACLIQPHLVVILYEPRRLM